MSPGEAGGQSTDLVAAHSYERAPPALTGCYCPDPHLLRYFYKQIQEQHASCQPEYMRWFERAYVFEASHIVLPDMSFVQDSITDFPGAEEKLTQLAQAIQGGCVPRLAGGKRTVVIAKAGAGNYGHTLVEILPKLINIARSPLLDIRLLLPQSMARFSAIILTLCRHFGIAADLAFVPGDDLVEVENLVYIGPVSLHNTRKSATLLTLRDAIWQCLDIAPAPSRRLYVERQPPGIRNLTNGAAVRAVLEGAGYETVHPAALSFEKQAALFSQASHIAGPLGAGLTNSLLAPPQCQVLMMDPGLADYFFWDLAALAGQSFTWMFSGPVSHWSWPLASSDFTVNLNGLRYALDGIG